MLDQNALAAQYAAGGYYYDDEPAPRDDWKRTVALLVGLGVLIFILGFLTIAFGRQLGIFGDDDGDPDEVVVEKVDVPNLDGMTVLEAEAALRDLGLSSTITERRNANVDAGLVFDQLPVPGQRLDPGEPVELIVSTGEAITVPTVITLTESEAIALLGERGYTAESVPEANAQEVGTVVSQSPPPGTEHPLDQPVIINVSTGPDQVVIPDMKNKSVAQALNELRDLGFTVADETIEEPSDTIDEGDVTRTDPAAAQIVAAGTRITIYVSSGVEQVSVPSVITLFYDTAELTLRNQGLVPVPEFRTVPFGDPQVGLVIEQNPGSFTLVDKGSEVVIVVGEAGPPPTSTTTTTTTTTTEPPADE
jgi:beta-lactam-binding protein with PASTA domain